MLDWLKPILGDAWNDKIEEAISQEIGRHFVSRVDFNAANAAKQQLESAVKERDAQLEALSQSQGDTNALKQEIEALKADNRKAADDYAAKLTQVKAENFVEARLAAAGCLNMKAGKALLAEYLAENAPGEDGVIAGLDEQIGILQTAADSAMLFKSPQPTGSTGLEHGNASELDVAQMRRDMGLDG